MPKKLRIQPRRPPARQPAELEAGHRRRLAQQRRGTKRLASEGLSVCTECGNTEPQHEPERYPDRSPVDWLVMLYQAGDNDLTEEMVLALQELVDEGPPEGSRIVAQLDPSGLGLPTQTYDFSYRLKRNGAPKLFLREYLVETPSPDETNTGNPKALAGFINWANDRYRKVGHRLLILSGHGSGTTEDFLLKDESAMDSMTIEELRLALEDVKKKEPIDIVGMDACFMSMFEVASQISDRVRILIGAEGLEPQFGWPYHRILRAAKAFRCAEGRSAGPEELATSIVDTYVKFYSDHDRSAGRSVDLAAIDLRKMGDLNRALFGPRGLADTLRRAVARDSDKITLAHWYAQTFKADQFVDLHDLCVQLHRRFGDGSSAGRACRRAIRALDGGTQAIDHPGTRPPGGGCILRSGCSGFAYQHSYGLSIYFPWAEVSSDYEQNTSSLSGLKKWSAFLKKQVKQTRREYRFNESARPSQSDVDTLAQFLTRHYERFMRHVRQRPRRRDKIRRLFAERVKRRVRDLSHMAPQDIVRDVVSRYTGQASKYTGQASKYTGQASKYTGQASKYGAGVIRSAEDRERSVKNLPPVVGKTFWPAR